MDEIPRTGTPIQEILMGGGGSGPSRLSLSRLSINFISPQIAAEVTLWKCWTMYQFFMHQEEFALKTQFLLGRPLHTHPTVHSWTTECVPSPPPGVHAHALYLLKTSMTMVILIGKAHQPAWKVASQRWSICILFVMVFPPVRHMNTVPNDWALHWSNELVFVKNAIGRAKKKKNPTDPNASKPPWGSASMALGA